MMGEIFEVNGCVDTSPCRGKANYRSSQAKEVMLGSEPQSATGAATVLFFFSPHGSGQPIYSPNFLWLPTVEQTY